MKKVYLTAVVLLSAAMPLAAQQTEERRPPRTLQVNGTGTVQRQPDRAVITIAVESRAATAQAAAQENAGKMEAVYAALRRLGLVPPNVQTISYELHPQYGRPDPRSEQPDQPRVTGYMATNMLRVQLDSILRVGAIIDATVAVGANRVANLSFELRDPETARLEALRVAVQKARAEAEVVAAAAGQRLGAPLSISSSSGWQPQPVAYRRDYAMEVSMSPPPPTPVEGGNLSVIANVSITYLLEDR